MVSIPALATHSPSGSGEIHGIKWNDVDGNGIFDAGESIMPNVTIDLTTSVFNATTGNFTTTLVHSITTGIDGSYNFTGLSSGQYTVSEIPPSMSIQTFPVDNESHEVSLQSSTDIVTDINFGNQIVGLGVINGTIFEDVTNLGVFDAGDNVLQNKWVTLLKFTSTNTFPSWIANTQTDVNGKYGFVDLEPGIYKVTSSPGFWPFVQTVPINNQPAIITVVGNTVTDVNLGYDSDFGTITGTTFIDINGNGVLDVGELPAAWNQVCASPGDTCVWSNSNGDYTFNLPPGTYDISNGQYSSTGTPVFTTINVPSLVNGQLVSDINLPYLILTPLPGDMDIPSSNGDVGGTPTITPSTPLTILKNIDFCTPVDDPLVTLTLSDGTALTQTMQNIPDTQFWSVDFGPVGSGQSTANIRVDVDCPADTVGYPEDISLIGPEDVIQIGDLIFYDPSGNIINQCTNEPIDGAVVTLKVAAPQGTTNFVIPQSNTHLPSTNPQITGSDGSYGWVTVPGDYKVTAQMPGFVTNTSPVVNIPPPVTGLDIHLTPVEGCATSSQDFDDVKEKIESLDLQNGIENSFVSKVNTAKNSFDNDNTASAINKLGALLNQINAQDGKKLSSEDADVLRECINDLIDSLSLL